MTTPATLPAVEAHFDELPVRALSGWPLVGLNLALLAGLLWILVPDGAQGGAEVALVVAGVLAFLRLLPGYFLVNPNMSRVMVLFGRYRGTVRSEGFHWTNPFTIKRQVSLRAHNLASQKIKVNDLQGNPIGIGAVVVWRVRDTAQACFDVEDYEEYVDVQTEAAIRNLAQQHPYDDALTETREFYFAASSVRKSVWSLVRQLRGPHLSTWA
jgi:regulator of protease activity HflC (stomatin/prohibitin superfamily)